MNRSEQLGNLAKALAEFQRESKNIYKSQSINLGRGKMTSASLEDIWDGIKPGLSKNGLSISQLIGGENLVTTVTTILMHADSGEYLISEASLPVIAKGMSEAQAYGANCTYLKKYALAAIAGVATSDDKMLDPDLQVLEVVAPKAITPPPAKEPSPEEKHNMLIKVIAYSLEDGPEREIVQKALAHFGIKELDELDGNQLQLIVNRVDKLPKE